MTSRRPGPLMIDLENYALTGEDRKLLRHPLVGGVVLFRRNYRDLAQLSDLTRDIRTTAGKPFVIAVDQEGGRVQRFVEGFTSLPALRRLGEIWDRSHEDAPGQALQSAWNAGFVMALECRRAGVDISFAPVLDLDTGVSEVIGDRAIHGDPRVVARIGAAYWTGMRAAGMAGVVKHFPGHGNVAPDTHYAPASDPRGWEELDRQDLYPFRHLIERGVEGVMMAHVRYPRVDADLAGYSSHWIHDILRGRLGFQGAVFSDDLTMQGAAGDHSLQRRAELALAAGCDWILVCNNRTGVLQLRDGLGDVTDLQAVARRITVRGSDAVPIAELLESSRYQQAVRDLRRLDR